MITPICQSLCAAFNRLSDSKPAPTHRATLPTSLTLGSPIETLKKLGIFGLVESLQKVRRKFADSLRIVRGLVGVFYELSANFPQTVREVSANSLYTV